MSYFVERRAKEIGIRIALGAHRSDVVQLVVQRALIPVGAGLILGLIASWPVHQIVRSVAYGASLYHPLTFAAVIGILLSVAGVATYLPARRTFRADPTSVLKRE